MNVNTHIPVKFEYIKGFDYADSRFQKVKIWLMHLGKNYNKSIFEKDAVEQAIPTLSNTPILGFVEEDMSGEKDFRGHEIEIVIENGDIKTKYIGSAYGVIPENCNPRFEQKMGDTGEMLTYLVVDGLLWTKFEDPIDILNQRGGEVSQSMELFDEYDGFWDADGYFHFTKFAFNGACMLGKDVLPAMQKASVQVFSANVIQEEIANKLEEFSRNFKEVEHEMTLEELLAKYSLSQDDLKEKQINVEDYSIEDLEGKIKEVFADTNDKEDNQENDDESNEEEKQEEDGGQEDGSQEDGQEDEADSDEGESDDSNFSQDDDESEGDQENDSEDQDEENGEENTEEKFTLNFQLSHDDIRRQLWDKVDSYMESKGFGTDWYYLISVYDNKVYVENDAGNKFYKLDYTSENDVINFSDVVEVFPMFLTAEEKGALNLIRSNYEKLEQENQELKDFKKDVMKESHEAQVEELISNQFSKLSDEDVSEIKEKMHDFTIEEIETKLFEKLGRKMANFTKKENKTDNRLIVKLDEASQNKTDYSHLFAKHGLKAK